MEYIEGTRQKTSLMMMIVDDVCSASVLTSVRSTTDEDKCM